jgi:DNA-binding beta-propeller fold protein YncE
MKDWALTAIILVVVWSAGCGGNSTTIGVTVLGPGNTTTAATVLLGGTGQFSVTVSGSSTTTVYWQVCLPSTTTSTITPPPPIVKPTHCTPIPGVTAAPGTTVLTGYGTITQTGLYTAPLTIPSPNNAVILATSTINTNAFGTLGVTIDSGVRVQLQPTTATIDPLETFQFTATVTGSTNTGVTWTLSSSAPLGTPLGTISSTGLYTAPQNTGDVTVTAQSVADPTQEATASVTVTSTAAPGLTSIDPQTAAQGSVQQDVYLSGTNFLSTETVVVTAPGQTATPVTTTFISPALLRATIPAAQLAQAGIVQIAVQKQNGDLNTPGPANLTVAPVRPGLVASTPDSVSQNNATASVSITGGYFAAGTTSVTFNGLGPSQGIVTSLTNSRQLSVQIPGGNLTAPGLYPIFLQNAGIPADQPSLAAVNLAVTANPAAIPAAPTATIAVGGAGSSPSSVAVDYAQGIAVVVNTGTNSVSLINLSTKTVIGAPIAVGNHPTGVAVDDLLPHPLALVVNNTDQTVTTIDLTTQAVVGTPLSIAIAVNSPGSVAPLPYAIGINPVTHRALVAYQSANQGAILDLANTQVCATPPCLVTTIGGSTSTYSTGANPAVVVDPQLNWAIVSPGGGGSVNMVDLGIGPSTNDPMGRSPSLVANLLLPVSTQGIGLNPETHQALLTDPSTGTLSTFSLLTNAVATVAFPSNGGAGGPVDQPGFVAAAASPLGDVGIAVSTSSTAMIVGLESGVVLQTVNGLGANPQAVAIDPVTNQALVANQNDGTVSFVSLGPAINPLQVIESSPAISYTSSSSLTLTVTGGDFPSTAVVRLDQTPLVTTGVPGTCTATAPVTCRQLAATVPASMLGAARRFAVDVESAGAVSNVMALTVIQAVAVGNSPVGVAVDTDRDMAVVTNYGDGTVSLVALTPSTPTGQFGTPAGSVGTVGSPITVGTNPAGVAVSPRLGLATVSNNGSNNASVVDERQVNVPVTVSLCDGCTAPVGVAIDQDTGVAAIADTNANTGNPIASGSLSFVNMVATPPVETDSATIDQNPVAVAIQPVFNPINPALGYAGVATASQTSSVEFLSVPDGITEGRVSSGVDNPGGIFFDPLNQVFLTANNLENNVIIINPTQLIATAVTVGIGPVSVDYNFQTSTLVTANSGSHTLGVLDYLCPPAATSPTCPGPQVRALLGLGGTQVSTPILGANVVAIDPKLNLAALVDEDNNRILLVPLPY